MLGLKILIKLFCQLSHELTSVYISIRTYLPAFVGKNMVNIQANPASVRKHIIVLRLPDLEGNKHPDKDGNKVLQHFFEFACKTPAKAHSSINNRYTPMVPWEVLQIHIIFLFLGTEVFPQKPS